MRAYERLLKYIKYNTQSSEETGTSPSTDSQFVLARALAEELKELGCAEVILSEYCYVYAKLPATKGYEGAPTLAFIAHMDTATDFSGDGVTPRIIENYDGGDVSLSDSGLILSSREFPHLKGLKGRTLITTDGKTLLGADDKAGIAEIMTLIENIQTCKIPHGPLSFVFTPDEEIGEGTAHFDLSLATADVAFTVDGGEEGSLEYENFNAASAKFNIRGFSVHPGSAKDKMINASLVAFEINSMLPSAEIPAKTEGYEGFYHVTGVGGSVSEAWISYIVRDHDMSRFSSRLDTLSHIEKVLSEKYGKGTVTLEIKQQYKNMKEKILPVMRIVEYAKEAAADAGVEAKVEPIRGGTDGAGLSFMGLPCPNLGTGGYAFHGPFEHITAEGMDTVVKILENITRSIANEAKS